MGTQEGYKSLKMLSDSISKDAPRLPSIGMLRTLRMTQLNCFLAIYVYPDPLLDQTKIASDAPSDKTLLSQNSYCNTIGQSTFISFATCIACPLLKLILLVMYNWLNSFYCDINGKYSVILLFFTSNQ